MNEYAGLDAGVVPMVQFFNEHGLPTEMSCEGHNTTNQSMFWIEFAPSVTKVDLINFQRRYTHEWFAFCANGSFVERFYLDRSEEKEVVRSYYRYMAATKEAADEDLKEWKRMDHMHYIDAKKEYLQ